MLPQAIQSFQVTSKIVQVARLKNVHRKFERLGYKLLCKLSFFKTLLRGPRDKKMLKSKNKSIQTMSSISKTDNKDPRMIAVTSVSSL